MATKQQNAPHTHHKPKYTDIKTLGKRSVENCHKDCKRDQWLPNNRMPPTPTTNQNIQILKH